AARPAGWSVPHAVRIAVRSGRLTDPNDRARSCDTSPWRQQGNAHTALAGAAGWCRRIAPTDGAGCAGYFAVPACLSRRTRLHDVLQLSPDRATLLPPVASSGFRKNSKNPSTLLILPSSYRATS